MVFYLLTEAHSALIPKGGAVPCLVSSACTALCMYAKTLNHQKKITRVHWKSRVLEIEPRVDLIIKEADLISKYPVFISISISN